MLYWHAHALECNVGYTLGAARDGVDGSGDLDCDEFEAVLAKLAASDWEEAFDGERGKAYYYNKQTNETRWHRPDGESAVSEFMKANGLVLQPLVKPPALDTLKRSEETPPALETLRRSGSNSSKLRAETTHNPMSMSGATFDVEAPQSRTRTAPRVRARTAAGVLGESPPAVAPRPGPRRAVPARQTRPVPSLPTRGGVPTRHAAPATPRRARAPTTHDGADRI